MQRDQYIAGLYSVDEEPTGGGNPEMALWRAVVARMLEDAGIAPTTAEHARVRLEARRWFRSRDFRTVCDLADVPPSAVLARVPG